MAKKQAKGLKGHARYLQKSFDKYKAKYGLTYSTDKTRTAFLKASKSKIKRNFRYYNDNPKKSLGDMSKVSKLAFSTPKQQGSLSLVGQAGATKKPFPTTHPNVLPITSGGKLNKDDVDAIFDYTKSGANFHVYKNGKYKGSGEDLAALLPKLESKHRIAATELPNGDVQVNVF